MCVQGPVESPYAVRFIEHFKICFGRIIDSGDDIMVCVTRSPFIREESPDFICDGACRHMRRKF